MTGSWGRWALLSALLVFAPAAATGAVGLARARTFGVASGYARPCGLRPGVSMRGSEASEADSSPFAQAAAAVSAFGERLGAIAGGAYATLKAGGGSAVSRTRQLEAELLAMAASGSVAETLAAFEVLERKLPAPADLLRSAPELLDGRWLLVATVAAQVGGSVTDSRARAGVVNASGFVVDASQGTLPVQEVDLKRGRIANEIVLKTPPFFFGGQRFYLRVSGAFTAAPPPAPGTRALITFDSLEIFTAKGKRLLSLGWIFSLVRRVKPALQNGDDDASWLDTTYIGDSARLGRGNKGSVFVLERLIDGGGPLVEWPL
ncbi:hypothetical protein T492DRAFT_933121 [Pavlovales sp. CCMP2436]|nr:hypothetical protein T492DRAFT_933121 [Pavlovales sp. CCMP2436]